MHVTVYVRINRKYRVATRKDEAPFFLRYQKDGKRVWQEAGVGYYNEAVAQARLREAALLRAESDPPKPSPAPDPTLEQQRIAFLHDKQTTVRNDGTPLDLDTVHHYTKKTREFLDAVKRKHAREITKQDMKDWMAALREHVSHRTVCNIYVSIACFLKFCGVDHKTLLSGSERPIPVEETPEAYSEEEVAGFLACSANDRVFYDFLYKTGAREREATHLEWSDLDLGLTPTVTFRTKVGFRTKTGKSRTVPLQDSLAAELRNIVHQKGNIPYVFGDKPRTHMLDRCKRIAKAAGYDPTSFWLHKFRDTFATHALRRGVDIRTVQHWMGHADIEQTMRYLAPAQGGLAQSLINQAFQTSVTGAAAGGA